MKLNRRSFLKFFGMAPAVVALPAATAIAAAVPATVGITAAAPAAAGVISVMSMAWAGAQWFGSGFAQQEAKRELEFSMSFERREDLPEVGDVIDVAWIAARYSLGDASLFDNMKFVVLQLNIEVQRGAPMIAHITAREVAG